MHATVIISFVFVGFVIAYMLGTYVKVTFGFLKNFYHHEEN